MSEKRKIYYKVVRPNLCSITCEGIPSFDIQYSVGKWIKPKLLGSCIFIFETESAAKGSIRKFGWYNGIIYKAYAKGVSRFGLFYNECWMEKKLPEILSIINKLKRQKRKFTHLYLESNKPPDGTLFAKEVMLLEESENQLESVKNTSLITN